MDYIVEKQEKDYNEWINAIFTNSNLYISTILANIDDIDGKKLKWLLIERFDDPNIIDFIRFLFASIKLAQGLDKEYNYYNHFIKAIEILGSGAQGTVSSGSLNNKNVENILAIKNVNNFNDIESLNLKREFMISLQLSKLFDQTPIFSQGISLIPCSNVVTSLDGNIAGFCERMDRGPASVNLLVPGPTFFRAIFTADEFYRAFIILLDGLTKSSIFNFVHYDLHTNNIIMRKLAEPVSFPISLNGRLEYIEAYKIPVIIDYGLSRIDTDYGISNVNYFLTDGKYIGQTLLKKIYNNSSDYFPLHDIYKFLFNSFYKFPQLLSSLFWIGRYFHTENITVELLNDLRKNRNFILSDNFKTYTHQDFYYWLRNQPEYINLLNHKPTARIYGKHKPIDLYKELNINFYKYNHIDKISEWYFYKIFGDPNVENEMFQIVSEKYNIFYQSFIDKIKNFIYATEYNLKYLSDYISDETKMNIMGTIGNLFIDLKNEDIAMNLFKNTYNINQDELQTLFAQIMNNLIPYQEFYRKYLYLMDDIIYPG